MRGRAAVRLRRPGGIAAVSDGHEEDGMSESTGRGAAEERGNVPDTPAEHNEPASPESTPGGDDSRARGAAEESADAPPTE